MGHKNNQIINEVIEQLKSMSAFSQSRYLSKKEHTTQDKIFSYSTFNNYKAKCCDFAKFAKKEHHCYTLAQAKPYVIEFLKTKIDNNYSPWTIRLYCSALSKLYQTNFSSQIDLPIRHRSDIKRSRTTTSRDRHFSETKNKDFVDFCKSCGLRRSELANIKGKDLVLIDGQYYIYVESGKGGKSRYAPILDNNPNTISKMQSTPPNERVWPKPKVGSDIHYYRRCYCNSYYQKLCPTNIPKEDRYICRRDRAKRVLSRSTLYQISTFMGHSRCSIIAYNYLD